MTELIDVESILPPHHPSARTSWLGCHCIACVGPCLCDTSVVSRPSGVLLTLFASFLLPSGMGKKDDPKLMQEWFKLVQEKNALVRYESELMIL